ncbi:hypothetical protein GCM10027280_27420 [Micromonospora polyrhachis]
MHRLMIVVSLVLGVVAGTTTPIPVAAAGAVAAAPTGVEVCEIDDERLDEISGMVATNNGYVVINDSSDVANRRRIFYLNRNCAVTRTVSYPSRPRDSEDLALASDGTLWVADVGDNDAARETVALWKLLPGSTSPVIHRLSYPDGARDAEALLLTGDGTPIIVTKDPFRPRLYAPAEPLRANKTVRLTAVGEFRLPTSRTSNPFGLAGRFVVTGAATAADGTRVVLRTYADAFEFKVADGDPVKAITQGKPTAVPLPDEPQGESISYTPDGRFLVTVSEVSDAPAGTRPVIRRYPSAVPAGPASAAPTGPGHAVPTGPAQAAPTASASERTAVLPSAAARESDDATRAGRRALLGVVLFAGVAGVVLVMVGGAARLRDRRRPG